MLDADALGPQLCVRPWRAGDRVAPSGLAGTKTLADLFVDRRLPRAHRHTIPIVEAGGAIAWIPEIVTAERFRVTEATRTTAWLRARRTKP